MEMVLIHTLARSEETRERERRKGLQLKGVARGEKDEKRKERKAERTGEYIYIYIHVRIKFIRVNSGAGTKRGRFEQKAALPARGYLFRRRL